MYFCVIKILMNWSSLTPEISSFSQTTREDHWRKIKTMYLLYYLDSDGNRVYTLKVQSLLGHVYYLSVDGVESTV